MPRERAKEGVFTPRAELGYGEGQRCFIATTDYG
jgi:hypothetical protein